ncbi:hypothetical protein EXU85_24605 [Spirosoma sp. KCTC 42546]|uniref:hypothetical protein n=1 Tax=Spirosoma sp. KCTC 42546 TaxID=2520506 RepID=UPI001157D521|nr:hypothetical protein [Spirosoma sp. KCTC 42546]QDK81619.1 hypothetical protein EXU85_24605 [Spirosoma sp. KCTC 42546]
MKTFTISSPKNIHLLKEYIKTFIATEVVFPGVLPRQWGVAFSPSELNAMYAGLKFVIRKAHPLQDKAMIAAFEQIQEAKALDLHWFLYDYWHEVVAILGFYPNLGTNYLFIMKERNEYMRTHRNP